MKLRIVDAGNVTVPAFLELQKRGYDVRCEKSADGSRETWIAESDATQLFADDLVALLGLAGLAESRGANWRATDSQIDDFLNRFGYHDVG